MRGNSFGKLFSVTSFGESHGAALGAIIDGVPGGLTFSYDDLCKELSKRAPGHIRGTSSRKEADKPVVLSGIYEGKTLGTPIAVIVYNTNQNSKDYEELEKEFRPGHADKTTLLKYGIRDHRGGGRSSGRETLARVIAGYFAGLLIPQIEVFVYVKEMGTFKISTDFSPNISEELGPYYFPDLTQTKRIENYLLDLKKSGESIGGRIKVIIKNTPSGLGEPCFDKLKADFAKALLSIGACVSFSMGEEDYLISTKGSVATSSSLNYGGIEGGISNGENIEFEVGIKATSTIGDKAKQGRHDPCILPRVVPVISAMCKITLADHFLRQRAYQIFS